MVAFVITTAMPTVSHAFMCDHDGASAMMDCDHGADKTTHSTKMPCCDKHAKNEDKKPCRDNGMCKCLNGMCGSGLTKIFNNHSDSQLRLTSSQSRFDFVDEHLDSALSERLKRPPKA